MWRLGLDDALDGLQQQLHGDGSQVDGETRLDAIALQGFINVVSEPRAIYLAILGLTVHTMVFDMCDQQGDRHRVVGLLFEIGSALLLA